MLETNVRFVAPGPEIYLNTRCVEVVALDCSPEQLQGACSLLRRRGVAAVPDGSERGLLVAVREPIASFVIEESNWSAEIRDGGVARQLRFVAANDVSLLTQLIERSLLIEIGRRTRLWTLDSPRIWYEPTPFQSANGIAAHRRFEVSAMPIEGIGVGLVVDVGTAFFTTSSVGDFFQEDGSAEEQRCRRSHFEFLSERQQGQKGTLLYDTGVSRHKCYFEQFRPGLTCGAPLPIPIRVNGRDYNSVLEYYRYKYPDLPIQASDPVAMVSFPGIDQPQPVAATRLFLRVMNSALPDRLTQVDKIAPDERHRLIHTFWELLEDAPLGRGKPPLLPGLWMPREDSRLHIRPRGLLFAQGHTLSAPARGTLGEYKAYYRQRRPLLQEHGCLKVPPAMTRRIHIALAHDVEESTAIRLAESLISRLSQWTRKPLEPQFVRYRYLDDAFAMLQQEHQPGLVVFVFNDADPAAYFTVAYELKRWRVKRITQHTLMKKFATLRRAEHGSPHDDRSLRAVRDWDAFMDMTALDVLQQLDCVPWTLAESPRYEAQLVIDVGEDRRHFGVTLWISRPPSQQPAFWLDTVIEVKADPKRETINPIHLCDKIVALFQRMPKRQYDPLRSLLVLRDGRECGRELDGIHNACKKLFESQLLDPQVRVDVVDFHKHSVKGIRLWDRSREGEVRHALEGSALFLDARTVVLTNTGAATLHQGTAEPLILVARGNNIDMGAVATDVYAGAQLNFDNPDRAPRYPLALKRTDEALKQRAAQEIRRLR